MSERYEFSDLDALFTRALDLPAEECLDLVTQVSQDSPELAAALSRLLERAERAEDFLGKRAESSRDTLLARSLASVHARDHAAGLQPGDFLGPYRIEETIGRGLRSVVYLAAREEADWTQKVAIKVLARGVNTDDVHRRFLAERQILTQLRYPGISILLDGGVTDDGLPYFVMEYIDGLPITEYCQKHRLDLDARISLFRQVCQAVAHAHRHLVVHRDIKPSNILVNQEGEVKLLDFGIAKLLEPPSGESPYLTAADTRPMTPAYSSPEQLKGEAVTTATDVYQLGLLLAEMLTGEGPARSSLGIESHGVPARAPSRVSGGEKLPYSLRDLRGDLDWIVLRAVEPNPEDRYASAAELLADIDRHRNDLPVSARSWTVAYVARKFVRRRPGIALAVGLTSLALVGYAVLVGYFNVSLARERSAAVEAAAQAEETKDLLISFLSSPDPYSGTGANTRVIDLLANAEAVVSEQLAHRPELQIEVLASLADVYQNLSVIDRAIALRQQELEIRRALGPSQALPILTARRKLAVTNLQSGAVEPALVELNAVLAELSESHPRARLEIAQTRHAIGALLVTHGSGEAARPYLEAAVEALRLDGSEPVKLAAALSSYALVFEDYSVRLEYEKEAFALREKYQGPEHPATLGTAAQIAATLTDLSRYEESLEIYQSLIPPVERAFGPLHTETLGVLNNLAVTLSFNGDIEAALERHQDILERRRQKYGDTHPLVAGSLQNVGASLNELGRLEESIPFLNEASRIYPEVNLPGNPVTAYPHISLAGVYSELDRIDELERHARRAIELLEGNVSEDNVALLKSRCLLGAALIQRGQAEVGIPMVRHAVDGMAGQTRISPRHIEQCRGILERAVPTEDGPQVQDQDPDLPQTS